MSEQAKTKTYTLHPFDERQFRHRFLPGLQGDEPIVRELLEAANASGPSWTALHKLFDESRPLYERAVEILDGAGVQKTAFAGFARLQAHLRPAFAIQGAGLSQIDRASFPDLCSFIKSAGVLLTDSEGKPLEGIPAALPARVPGLCLAERSGGGVVLKEDVRPFLQALRGDLPRLAEHFSRQGLPAEEAITMLLAAAVEAKLKGTALFEAVDALVDDTHLPKDHLITYENAENVIPLAVRREAARVFGKTIAAEAPAAPAAAAAPKKSVPYSPQQTYRVGQRIEHTSFGSGEVTRILDSRRLKVRFPNEEKTLAQGLKPRISKPPAPASAEEDVDPAEQAV